MACSFRSSFIKNAHNLASLGRRGEKLGLGYGKKAHGEMKTSVTKDSMNSIVFHGKYDEMKPMPVSKGQYDTASQRAPFANFYNSPPPQYSGKETEGVW